MNKITIKNEVFNFLDLFGNNIKTKLTNICAKTGQYDVPSELFQKRTSRANRILISWKDVVKNNLSLKQLNTISSGVTVEFRNNDFFEEENKKNDLYNYLINHLGCDETVSSIISIRSEAGSSSSSIQRECFEKLINNLEITYKNEKIILNSENYNNFSLKRLLSGGKGNEKWSGFLYISIKGGQQDTIETHRNQQLPIFNPACEYANEDVIQDINLVLAYFALLSITSDLLEKKNLTTKYNTLKNNLVETLKQVYYNISDFSGNLYDYCSNHYSTKMYEGFLYDPIQLKQISIDNFSNKKRLADSIDLTHNEAVEKCIFYWDNKKNCLLSPARPTNLFWSFHLSNMMQQNYTLNEFFEYEKERFTKRQKLLTQKK